MQRRSQTRLKKQREPQKPIDVHRGLQASLHIPRVVAPAQDLDLLQAISRIDDTKHLHFWPGHIPTMELQAN